MRALLSLLLLGPACPARPARAEAPGYVVRVDSGTLYLDFGKDSGAFPGRGFAVYTEGPELRHPVTGASLGRIEETIAEGRILEVKETYSTGVLVSTRGVPAPGQRARLGAPASAPPAGGASGAWRVLAKTGPFGVEAVDLAAGDLDGDGEPELVLAGEDEVWAYSMKEGVPRLLARYKEGATAARFLSADAADLEGDGRAEVFVSLDNRFFGRLESFALALDSGTLVRKASMPWLVRAFHDSPGASIASQQALGDSLFPSSPIRRLRWDAGRYLQEAAPLKVKGLGWLYGFALSRRGRQTLALLPNAAGRLRLQWEKNSWTSPGRYGQTSSRARRPEGTLSFHPRLALDEGPEGLLGVYALRAIPRFGALAESQGLYSRSELHYLRFDGSALDPAWTLELPGYCPGLAEPSAGPGGERRLWVAVRPEGGGTSVWTIRR